MSHPAERPCRQCGKPIIDVAIVKADGKPGRQVLDARAPCYVAGLPDESGTLHATRHASAFVSHFSTCAKASAFSKPADGGPSLVDELEAARREIADLRARLAVATRAAGT